MEEKTSEERASVETTIRWAGKVKELRKVQLDIATVKSRLAEIDEKLATHGIGPDRPTCWQ